MLEHGEVLVTWQLSDEPVDASSLPIPARSIGDHRKAYLDYEGPVSGDRGHVKRVDGGAVDILELTAQRSVFDLRGDRFSGRFRMRLGDDGWVFETADS